MVAGTGEVMNPRYRKAGPFAVALGKLFAARCALLLSSFFLLERASALVILSAEGAKDLLFGPITKAGPSLRARAARSAQDDNATRVLYKRG